MSIRSRVRRAFTLVEMLIAMALTLMLVYAIAEFYAYVGTIVKDGRAMIAVASELRGVTQRLKSDLDLLTCPVVPPIDDAAGLGYFELFEGSAKDWDANGNGTSDISEDADMNSVNDLVDQNVSTLIGDGDDLLAFTIRTGGEPFVGRWNGTMVTSSVAEVIWFTGYRDTNGDGTWQLAEPRQIYRRLLLIRPDLAVPAVANPFQDADISAHQTGTNTWAANTLADLTRRENRYAHNQFATNFPNALLLSYGTLTTWTLQGAALGEDILLDNVLAFDVRVYDPQAALRADDTNVNNARAVVQPGDVGWANAATAGNPIVGYGAYVDLYYGRYATVPANTAFSVAPATKSLLGTAAIYDTWATSYERDGYNQDYLSDGVGNVNTGPFDEGSNGVDDPDPTAGNAYQYGVDDANELETAPPYAAPLRGIEVRIRVYEPSTRQVRQATVGADFLPE